jgi:hypothetical protein
VFVFIGQNSIKKTFIFDSIFEISILSPFSQSFDSIILFLFCFLRPYRLSILVYDFMTFIYKS